MIEITTTYVRVEAEVTGAEPITGAGLTGTPFSVVAMYTRGSVRDEKDWSLEAIEIPCRDMRAEEGSDWEPPAEVARRFSDVPPTLERTMNHVRQLAGPVGALMPETFVREAAQEILDQVEPSMGQAPDWALVWAEENLPGRELPKRAPAFIRGEHGPETIFPRETRRSANLADFGADFGPAGEHGPEKLVTEDVHGQPFLRGENGPETRLSGPSVFRGDATELHRREFTETED